MMNQVESITSSLENVQELDIKDWKHIFEMTPEDQAIMVVGIHGIGKSEFIKYYFESRDYAVIMIFLGQMADAGDLIGLPDRTIVTFIYNGQEINQKITEFCPPKWWPRNNEAKLVIFLDEFNRGKPEVYQCIMDMTLNRQLNGLKLPEHTRIIAAINPLDDKYGYQVTELDPALFDRFNVYGFSPSRKEWIYWAIDSKVHKLVITFIAKFGALYLDPPSNGKMGIVYPSRRSWVRLSNILKKNPKILTEEDFVTLRNISSGIIGEGASAAFYAFVKEQIKSIHPGRIITAWDEEIEKKVKDSSNQELLVLNLELALHLEEEEDQYFGDMASPAGKKQLEKYGYNIWQYLQTVPREIMADFYDYLSDSTVEKKKSWPSKLLDCNIQGLVNEFINIIQGKTKEEKQQEEEHFADPDMDELLKG
jgi:hypothetical protein